MTEAMFHGTTPCLSSSLNMHIAEVWQSDNELAVHVRNNWHFFECAACDVLHLFSYIEILKCMWIQITEQVQ